MEKSVCLACVLVSLTCLVIILLIGCILIFYLKKKKIKKLRSDLDQLISKLQTELNKTSLEQTNDC